MYWDTNNGQQCLGCEYSGEMRSTTRSRDKDFDAATLCLLAIRESLIWSPVRGDDHQFVRNPEIRQNRNSLF